MNRDASITGAVLAHARAPHSGRSGGPASIAPLNAAGLIEPESPGRRRRRNGRWSARRALAFALVASGLLWGLVGWGAWSLLKALG